MPTKTTIPQRIICALCFGAGACEECGAKGFTVSFDGKEYYEDTCGVCSGSCTCPYCRGSGEIELERIKPLEQAHAS
jgi:RecJ-like exonuclease